MKLTATNIVMLVLAIFAIYMLVKSQSGYMNSYFQLEGAPIDFAPEPMGGMGMGMAKKDQSAGSKSAHGMKPAEAAAALQPNEIPVTEDFAQFNTDYILSSQNYLDPRNQIGYPETVGGILRNANRQIRSEPPNPRDPVSIFNLSTITPELTRPDFEIGN